MYKHILVPTDGSALSLRAVRSAARLAETLGSRVTAIHVMQPFDMQMSSEGIVFRAGNLMAEYEKGQRAHAKKVLAKTAATVKVPCETMAVFHSNPWQAIVRAAET